jgi:hypothetical protein
MSRNVHINVPKDLSGIKLRSYQEYLKFIGSVGDNPDDSFVKIRTIELLCDISEGDVKDMKVSDVDALFSHLIKLFDLHTPLINKFDMTDPSGKTVTFGFIPKLEDMSMGEFVDIDSSISDWDNMHNAMAVLYRPISFQSKSHYLIKEYEGYEELSEYMKDMPISVALGALVFFYRLGKELSNYTMDYLMEQLKNKQHPMCKDLEKNGVGINQFMHSLKGMSEALTKLPNSLSKSALFG